MVTGEIILPLDRCRRTVYTRDIMSLIDKHFKLDESYILAIYELQRVSTGKHPSESMIVSVAIRALWERRCPEKLFPGDDVSTSVATPPQGVEA